MEHSCSYEPISANITKQEERRWQISRRSSRENLSRSSNQMDTEDYFCTSCIEEIGMLMARSAMIRGSGCLLLFYLGHWSWSRHELNPISSKGSWFSFPATIFYSTRSADSHNTLFFCHLVPSLCPWYKLMQATPRLFLLSTQGKKSEKVRQGNPRLLTSFDSPVTKSTYMHSSFSDVMIFLW